MEEFRIEASLWRKNAIRPEMNKRLQDVLRGDKTEGFISEVCIQGLYCASYRIGDVRISQNAKRLIIEGKAPRSVIEALREELKNLKIRIIA